ncbi:MAG TPA: type II toxin-antitoxin system HicB family antitoxin [Thermoanaerobaculia bacterium]|nr:type II toxin-antitoxin system HicB family antitoxin [Thermoanaerobaculia bacterium]
MAHEFSYPVVLTPDEVDGGFVVTFPDLPEAITQAEDVPSALDEAADALEEAIAGRIRRGDPIPKPSAGARGGPEVPVPALTAAKAALYLALRESGITKSDLAIRLGCDEKEVRRLLDPRHPSKLSRIEKALSTLGKGLSVWLVDEAA